MPGPNRSLALPAFFARAFPQIVAIFAANPGDAKPDRGKEYDYVRPLATIEPTAIARGLPVDAHIGFADIPGLEAALTAPEYKDATVVVAWEHRIIDVVASDLLAAHGGDAKTVPHWGETDFDSVYVLTITPTSASFAILKQGLDGLSKACPR